MKLTTQPDELAQVIDALSKSSAIGVDTEFIRETTFIPKLALLQVSDAHNSWLIDPLALGKNQLSDLLDIFTSPSILKIMHAAFADQECLFHSYNTLATPVLDTAVAAALCGWGDNISLEKLIRIGLDQEIKKGRARTDWMRRPLPRELLEYAAEDVRLLVPLGEKLKGELEGRKRLEWAMEESCITVEQFESDPLAYAEKSAHNAKIDAVGYSCLIELLIWREKRARDKDLPRQWVMQNETLLALAKTKPKSLEELNHFRGVKSKLQNQGEEILRAIQKGKTTQHPLPVRDHKGGRLTPNEEVIGDFVKAYVLFLSEKYQISSKYLLTTDGSKRLVAYRNVDVAAWVENHVISQRAADLVGEELQGLLLGKTGLIVQGERVQAVKIADSSTWKNG